MHPFAGFEVCFHAEVSTPWKQTWDPIDFFQGPPKGTYKDPT